jgi:hypothetical protein
MERQDIKLLKPPKEETVPPPPLTGQDLIEERVFEVRQHIVRALRQLNGQEQSDYIALLRYQLDDIEQRRAA